MEDVVTCDVHQHPSCEQGLPSVLSSQTATPLSSPQQKDSHNSESQQTSDCGPKGPFEVKEHSCQAKREEARYLYYQNIAESDKVEEELESLERSFWQNLGERV